MPSNENICTQLDALGIPWRMVRCRGEEQVFAQGLDEEHPDDPARFREIRVNRLVAGYPVCYYDRRRYSNKTFTWVYALVDGVWRNLGDPWECVMPSDNSVRQQILHLRQVYATA